jgi:hypothetical protein
VFICLLCDHLLRDLLGRMEVKEIICVVDYANIAAPVFEVKPIDQVKAEGADAEFVCKPGGSPTPTLTWMSNGRPLDSRCQVPGCA